MSWGARVKPRPEERSHVPDACAIAAVASLSGNLVPGSGIVEMLKVMGPRYNGLGGGFAAYDVYPDFPDNFVLHVMFEDEGSRREFERRLGEKFRVAFSEEVPTRSGVFEEHPITWRYFLGEGGEGFKGRVFRFVMAVDEKIDGAYVVSSGRNMAVFKGIGRPDKVAEFYRVESYKAAMWLGHGRYPTNSPGWWGGAHPFNILGLSVVHNGEISSYGISKRYLASKGYKFIFLTDSEMLSYAFDYLLRVEKLSVDEACKVLSPRFWKEIGNGNEFLKRLRIRYQELHVNGPFSIAVGMRINGDLYMLSLTDRLKLRPLVVGMSDDLFMASSEECGIRAIEPNVKKIWRPKAGEPVLVKVKRSEN